MDVRAETDVLVVGAQQFLELMTVFWIARFDDAFYLPPTTHSHDE